MRQMRYIGDLKIPMVVFMCRACRGDFGIESQFIENTAENQRLRCPYCGAWQSLPELSDAVILENEDDYNKATEAVMEELQNADRDSR